MKRKGWVRLAGFALLLHLVALWRHGIDCGAVCQFSRARYGEVAEIIQYQPKRASNGLFVTVESYLINTPAARRLNHSAAAGADDDIVFVLIGMGEFATTPQSSDDEALGNGPYVPQQLQCAIGDVVFDSHAVLHRTGSAFEHAVSKSSGRIKYFGERAVLISCVVPQNIQGMLRSTADPVRGEQAQSAVRVFDKADGRFDTFPITPKWFLSKGGSKEIALCTTPVYDLSGSRYLTEWLFYHHFAQKFDRIHLYVYENGPKTAKTIRHLADRYSNWLVVHNWTSVLNGREDGLHPFKGVERGVPQSVGYEHAQRLMRTDCYLRNYGISQWIGLGDIDELFYTVPGIRLREDVLLHTCAAQPVCRLHSVTVFPVRYYNQSMMFLESLNPYCEPRCVEQFNCGIFNYGREKYLIKSSKADPMPWTILALHSVSDNHDFSHSFGHVRVGKNKAFIRHFNPTTYRKAGGYSNGISCPLAKSDTSLVWSKIMDDDTLAELYRDAKDEERFLKLNNADSPWRFTRSRQP